MVDYLELVTGNDKAASLLADFVLNKVDDNYIWRFKVNENDREEIKRFYISNYIHTHVERSLNILHKHFLNIMEEQQIFGLNEDK
jgi:hypothetical protein